MKRIIFILFAFIITFSSSCNKWLDVKPENEQISDSYWSNKEEVEAVLGAAYVKMQQSVQLMLVWGEARGNGLSLGGFINNDLQRFKSFDVIPSNSFVKWSNFYSIINYANMVIRYAPEVVAKDPSFNEATMRSYLSEAYYLRALAYFYIVRNFKDAPLILEPYMDDQASFEVATSTSAQIFTQIISDLQQSIGSSKEFWPTVWETKGRVTKWTVYATLADVYLWTEQYDLAIEACDKVLNSGRVGLIQGKVNTKNNWFTIFSPGNSNEGIFEIQFDFTKNQTNGLISWFGSSYNWIISPLMVSRFQQNPDDIRGLAASYSGVDFKVWKYLGSEGGTAIPRQNNDQNWILYRMADIYLMKAEAYVMKGASHYQEALDLVSAVRARAGITQPLSIASNQLEMLNIVLNEKALEFIGEGKRWYDLLRVGKRNNYEYKDYLIEQVLLGTAGGSSPIIRSKLLNNNSHYLPIHIDELKSNRLLVQNPYYDSLN